MSSGNTINIQMTIDDHGAFRVWQRQQNEAAKTEAALKRVGKAGGAAGSQLAGIGGSALRFMADAATSLTGIGSVLGGLAAMAKLLQKELDQVKQRQQGAATQQTSLAPILDDAIRNVGGQLTPTQVRNLIKKTAIESGSTPEKAGAVLGATWAGGTPSSPEAAVSSGTAAVKVLKLFPGEETEGQAQIASTTQMLVKQGMTEDEALGFLLRAGEGHKSRKIGPLAKYAVPTGIRGTAFGTGLEFSQAVVNQFSHEMGDEDGAISSHSAQTFMQQVSERFPKMSLPDAIQKLRNNPRLAKAYTEGGMIEGKKFPAAKMGEGASLPTVEGYLGISKDPTKNLAFEKTQQEAARMGNKAQWRARHQQGQSDALGTPEQILAAEQRKLESAKQLQQMASTDAAAAGIARKGQEDMLANSDRYWVENFGEALGANLKTAWGTNGRSMAETALTAERLAREQDMMQVPDGPGFASGGPGGAQPMKWVPNPNASEEQRIKAANYRNAAQKLRELEAQRTGAVGQAVGEEANALVTPADAARQSVKDLRNASIDLQVDDHVTAAESAGARAKIGAASHAVNIGAASLTMNPAEVKALRDEISRLSDAIKGNTRSTDANSKANNNAAGGGKPVGPAPLPTDGQASRRLDRRYQPV